MKFQVSHLFITVLISKPAEFYCWSILYNTHGVGIFEYTILRSLIVVTEVSNNPVGLDQYIDLTSRMANMAF